MNDVPNEVTQGLEEELPALWRFALKLTADQDDAADLVQRTCLRALEQRASYDAQGKLRSWLFRIEHRIWLNELRSRKIRDNRSFSYSADLEQPDSAVDESAVTSPQMPTPEGNVLLHQVYKVVDGLSENQRIVMILVCIEGFSYAEAAIVLDIPVGTVMSRLARARVAIGRRMLPVGTTNRSGASAIEIGGV